MKWTWRRQSGQDCEIWWKWKSSDVGTAESIVSHYQTDSKEFGLHRPIHHRASGATSLPLLLHHSPSIHSRNNERQRTVPGLVTIKVRRDGIRLCARVRLLLARWACAASNLDRRHLQYTIPPAIVLTLLYRPLCTSLDVYKIIFLGVVRAPEEFGPRTLLTCSRLPSYRQRHGTRI